jgi:hypothetical protein
MKLKRPQKWQRLHPGAEGQLLKIVSDAAIASRRIGDGRLIPLVILDTTNRRDMDEYIRVHQHLPPGDVESQWGKIQDSTGRVILFVSFKRPAELLANIEFNIVKQGTLVDQILLANCLYIQSSLAGDRFSKNPSAPKVLLEIPDTGFGKPWDKIFYEHIVKDMRNSGVPRRTAKRAAREFIDGWREFGQMRMKPT